MLLLYPQPNMCSFLRHAARGLHVSLLFVSLALSQDPTGVLQGQIKDPSGARVPKARVAVRNATTGFSANQDSEQDGSFRFSYLPVGEYELQVSAVGFAEFKA